MRVQIPVLKYNDFKKLPIINEKIDNTDNYYKNENKKEYRGVYTVADSLKESYIIKALQPDLGSLREFVHLKETPNLENYRISLLNKKKIKKNDDQETAEELFAKRNKASIKITDPIKTLKEDPDEKNRALASKMLIQQMVYSIYGDDIEKIEQELLEIYDKDSLASLNVMEPVLNIMKKYSKKTFEEKFEIIDHYLEKNHLTLKINDKQNSEDQGIPSGLNSIRKNSIEKLKILEKEESIFTYKQNESKISDFNKKKNHINNYSKNSDYSPKKTNYFLNKLRNKYSDFDNLFLAYENIKNEITESTKLFIQNMIKNFNIYIKIYQKANSNFFTKEGNHQDSIIFFRENLKLVSWNNIFNKFFILDYVLNDTNFHKLTHIEITNSKLNNPELIFLLEVILLENKNLAYLNLTNHQFNDTIIHILKKIIEKNTLKSLILSTCEITTKFFCILALGLANNNSLEEINFNGNLIENSGVHTIEMILRFIKNLKKIDFANNKITSYKELRKVMLFNKNINEKIIKM